MGANFSGVKTADEPIPEYATAFCDNPITNGVKDLPIAASKTPTIKRYAIMTFDEYESGLDSDCDDDRSVFLQGTFETWREALLHIYVRNGIFRNSYVAELNGDVYEKLSTPLVNQEWKRLMNHYALSSKLDAIRRDREERRNEQKDRLQDLISTINIVADPDRIPFGKEKSGTARRHLHNLLDKVYNETLWTMYEDSNLALNIDAQMERCRALPDYAVKARHELPRADASE